MKFDTIKWNKNHIVIIDQTKLPIKKKFVKLHNFKEVINAIKTLKVRGAPLIGIAGAYGIALAAYRLAKNPLISYAVFLSKLNSATDVIKIARPTAVNLMSACNVLCSTIISVNSSLSYDATLGISFRSGKKRKNPRADKMKIFRSLLKAALKIHSEDEAMCDKIGDYGKTLVVNNDTILTHCNAGSLATSAWGTALAPIYKAFESGLTITVYSDETRPLLQGSRLTAYELMEKGIKVITVCDNMAGYIMKLGKVSKILVGADRICKNGDFANKIGTYSIAVLAKENNIPFYVAAPSTSYDSDCKTGKDVPIEQRSPLEIIKGFGKLTAPADVKVFNPAFDVTDGCYVTAYITDKGIIYPPFDQNLKILEM